MRFPTMMFFLFLAAGCRSQDGVAVRDLAADDVLLTEGVTKQLIAGVAAVADTALQPPATNGWTVVPHEEWITNEVDTLATVAERGGFAGTETIAPHKVDARIFGSAISVEGLEATGENWTIVGGGTSGMLSSGNNWGIYGQNSGQYVTGHGWNVFGQESGNFSSGDYWAAYGMQCGGNASWSYSFAYGRFSGTYATGANRLYMDVYDTDPSAGGGGYDPSQDSVYLDNGQLNLGRSGALTNPAPNLLRGAWAGGENIAGITVAQVGGAVATNTPAYLSALAHTDRTDNPHAVTAAQAGAVAANAIPGPGCTDLGCGTNLVIGGATTAYLAAPAEAYTLSVASNAPAYTYALRIVSTNACKLGANVAFDPDFPWTVGGTNVLTLVPFSTNGTWLAYGRGS